MLHKLTDSGHSSGMRASVAISLLLLVPVVSCVQHDEGSTIPTANYFRELRERWRESVLPVSSAVATPLKFGQEHEALSSANEMLSSAAKVNHISAEADGEQKPVNAVADVPGDDAGDDRENDPGDDPGESPISGSDVSLLPDAPMPAPAIAGNVGEILQQKATEVRPEGITESSVTMPREGSSGSYSNAAEVLEEASTSTTTEAIALEPSGLRVDSWLSVVSSSKTDRSSLLSHYSPAPFSTHQPTTRRVWATGPACAAGARVTVQSGEKDLPLSNSDLAKAALKPQLGPSDATDDLSTGPLRTLRSPSTRPSVLGDTSRGNGSTEGRKAERTSQTDEQSVKASQSHYVGDEAFDSPITQANADSEYESALQGGAFSSGQDELSVAKRAQSQAPFRLPTWESLLDMRALQSFRSLAFSCGFRFGRFLEVHAKSVPGISLLLRLLVKEATSVADVVIAAFFCVLLLQGVQATWRGGWSLMRLPFRGSRVAASRLEAVECMVTEMRETLRKEMKRLVVFQEDQLRASRKVEASLTQRAQGRDVPNDTDNLAATVTAHVATLLQPLQMLNEMCVSDVGQLKEALQRDTATLRNDLKLLESMLHFFVAHVAGVGDVRDATSEAEPSEYEEGTEGGAIQQFEDRYPKKIAAEQPGVPPAPPLQYTAGIPGSIPPSGVSTRPEWSTEQQVPVASVRRPMPTDLFQPNPPEMACEEERHPPSVAAMQQWNDSTRIPPAAAAVGGLENNPPGLAVRSTQEEHVKPGMGVPITPLSPAMPGPSLAAESQFRGATRSNSVESRGKRGEGGWSAIDEEPPLHPSGVEPPEGAGYLGQARPAQQEGVMQPSWSGRDVTVPSYGATEELQRDRMTAARPAAPGGGPLSAPRPVPSWEQLPKANELIATEGESGGRYITHGTFELPAASSITTPIYAPPDGTHAHHMTVPSGGARTGSPSLIAFSDDGTASASGMPIRPTVQAEGGRPPERGRGSAPGVDFRPPYFPGPYETLPRCPMGGDYEGKYIAGPVMQAPPSPAASDLATTPLPPPAAARLSWARRAGVQIAPRRPPPEPLRGISDPFGST